MSQTAIRTSVGALRASGRPAAPRALIPLLALAVALAGCAPFGGAASPAGRSGDPAGASAEAVGGSPDAAQATPASSPSADPSPSPSPSLDPSPPATPAPSPSASPSPKPYRMDVYRAGVLVTQTNLLYCVPGASAIIINLLARRNVVDVSLMPEMYAYGQSLAVYANEGAGVDPVGWVGILDRWGAPGYAWHSYPTLGEALHHAALRIRQTGKPVGLTVGIHKEHAWVITGFGATADPANGAFTVTSIAVTGPLWPWQRYYLGYFDMPPDTWITPAKLAPAVRPFKADVPTQWDGLFVTIEP